VINLHLARLSYGVFLFVKIFKIRKFFKEVSSKKTMLLQATCSAPNLILFGGSSI